MQGPSDALPWEGQGAGAGASAAATPGGSALQPWGDAGGSARAGVSGGRDRSGNAEITPLEVQIVVCMLVITMLLCFGCYCSGSYYLGCHYLPYNRRTLHKYLNCGALAATAQHATT